MFKKIRRWYGDLTIRGKIFIAFFNLIFLIMIVFVSNALIQTRIVDPANDSLENATREMMLGKDFNFQFVQARSFEEQLSTTYIVYSYQGVIDLYGRHSPYIDNALSILDQLEQNRSKAEEDGDRTDEDELANINQVRQLVVDYHAFLDDLLNRLFVHGDQTKIVLDLLNEINQTVDASHAIDVVTKYTSSFDPKAMFSIPGALTDLQTAIEAVDLPADQKAALIDLGNQTRDAYNTLIGSDASMISGFTSLDSVANPVSDAIAEFIKAEVEEQNEAQEQLDKATMLRRNISIVEGLLVIVISLTIAFFTSKNLSRPIIYLAELAQHIADGNYDKRAEVHFRDEVGQLSQSFNKMIDNVAEREEQLRDQAEKLRVATARAKEATRLKSEFLANMSHELRTPLNAIIGYSDMLLMGMNGPLNEKQEHKVERLRENGIRLLNLINDVLDLSRIEARRVEVILKPFAPRTLLYRLRGQMEVLASDKGLGFELEIASDVPEMLISDEKRVEQVVVNLLANAFKFTSEGKVVLKSWINTAEQMWMISVSDTGIGIPPHARNLIFEEFRQLDGAPTRAYKGTGLGLAITRNLVKIMGGQIVVDSELGVGSTFTISLPLAHEESPELLEA